MFFWNLKTLVSCVLITAIRIPENIELLTFDDSKFLKPVKFSLFFHYNSKFFLSQLHFRNKMDVVNKYIRNGNE